MKKKDLKKLICNLPKVPGILGRERYFNSAILIPLIKINKEYYILFQKRAKHIRQGGDICFPGGGVEDIDKSFKHTALRETKEELGIKKKNIKIVGKLDTLVTSFGAIVEPYIGTIKKKTLKKMVLDKNEVEKTILIPLSFFKNYKEEIYVLRNEIKPSHINEKGEEEIYLPVKELGISSNYTKPWGIKKHKIWVYRYKNEVIWGMTALIINDLIKRY